jgi:hypothetical protein
MSIGGFKPFTEISLLKQIQNALGLVGSWEYLVFSKEEMAQVKALSDQIRGEDENKILASVVSWLPNLNRSRITTVQDSESRDKEVWLWAIQKILG